MPRSAKKAVRTLNRRVNAQLRLPAMPGGAPTSLNLYKVGLDFSRRCKRGASPDAARNSLEKRPVSSGLRGAPPKNGVLRQAEVTNRRNTRSRRES
jgi:hypothetical protein